MASSDDDIFTIIFGWVIGILMAIFCLFVIFMACSSIQFMFYLCVFGLFLWPFTLIIEFPYSLILAGILTFITYKHDVYNLIEIWIIRNNVSRTLMLIAHAAAGVLVGRFLGIAFHEMVSSTSPQTTFEIIGAVAFGLINICHYLRRNGLDLGKCVSSNWIISRRS